MLLPPSAGVRGSEDKEDLSTTRRLLHLAGTQTAFDIVDEATLHTPEQAVAISTRSVLAILSDLGAEIDVPVEDIRRGKTKPSIDLVGGESRPVIVIHSGPRSPADAYATVKTAGSVFWIDGADFDSKYAMTLVEYLIAISEVTDRTHAPLVTIPAN